MTAYMALRNIFYFLLKFHTTDEISIHAEDDILNNWEEDQNTSEFAQTMFGKMLLCSSTYYDEPSKQLLLECLDVAVIRVSAIYWGCNGYVSTGKACGTNSLVYGTLRAY